jgi:hypothetical protein
MEAELCLWRLPIARVHLLIELTSFTRPPNERAHEQIENSAIVRISPITSAH